jgi:hypothetical protein
MVATVLPPEAAWGPIAAISAWVILVLTGVVVGTVADWVVLTPVAGVVPAAFLAAMDAFMALWVGVRVPSAMFLMDVRPGTACAARATWLAGTMASSSLATIGMGLRPDCSFSLSIASRKVLEVLDLGLKKDDPGMTVIWSFGLRTHAGLVTLIPAMLFSPIILYVFDLLFTLIE